MTQVDRGLTFDQFLAGDRFVSPARTITEADVVSYAGLSWDYSAVQKGAGFSQPSLTGDRVVPNMLLASIATGLGNQLGVLEGTTLALLEQEIEYKRSVHIDDSVQLELIVGDKRESSKPDRGVVSFEANLINQEGQQVVGMRWTLLMKRGRSKPEQ